MIIEASQKYIRVSPQKVKFVADAVKKMTLKDMRTHLSYLNSEAARKLLVTLDQAFANAQHNFGLSQEQLSLESLLILRGPQYKRQRARSRGQGHAILKRTTHIVFKLKSVDGASVAPAKTEVKEDVKTEVVEAKVEKKKTAIKKPISKKAVKKVETTE